jgi:glyoxylase-like metal-dependent hydrolase (beta-lactamase superfamily II)
VHDQDERPDGDDDGDDQAVDRAGPGDPAEGGAGRGDPAEGGARPGGSVWEQLAPGVARRRLPHLDVTIGLVVGSEGVLVVDTGSTLEEGAELRAQVEALTGRPVTHVVLTHGHFDHVFGAAAFDGAEVCAARGLDGYLRAERAALAESAISYGTDPAAARAAADALVRTTLPVDGERVIDLGGRTVRLLHPGPGHTRHDIVVHVPGATASDPPVVFCGDLVEESGEPQAGADADIAGWPAALDVLLALGGGTARYVPGHGAVVDARFVRTQREALRSAAS